MEKLNNNDNFYKRRKYIKTTCKQIRKVKCRG